MSAAQYRSTLGRIAQQCQARYSSSEKTPFDKGPPGTTKPLYHMAQAHIRDSVDSWTLVQNQITFLDCKARNGESFNSDEKEFLVNLFEAMWWERASADTKKLGNLPTLMSTVAARS